MDIIFIKGIVMGILIAFPTGPVGFLTLRRSYLFGMRSAMYSTTGAVITDIFYGVIVGFGLKTIAKFLIMIAPYAELGAGIALIIIGMRSFTHRLDIDHHEGENTPVRDIVSTMVLNILNPTLIFSFTVLFTMIGMDQFVGNAESIIRFLIGIAVGTFSFWIIVSLLIKKLRQRAQDHYIHQANKYTGIILGIIGILLLILALVKIIL